MEKEAKEDNQYRQQLEQERRDHELALRLAEESNSQVDDSPLLMRKCVNSFILLLVFFPIFDTFTIMYIYKYIVYIR